MFNDFSELSQEERQQLNKMFREGLITKKELREKMKNGFFDHERLEVDRKYRNWLHQRRKQWG